MAAKRRRSSVDTLVVGDWLLNEQWVVGPRRSATSSRTGSHHSRILQTSDSTMISLGGAGLVSSQLHQAKSHGRRVFRVCAIGRWHPNDTSEIAQLVNPRYANGRTPHTLTPHPNTKMETIQLSNIADTAGKAPILCGTTRVIRICRPTGDKLDLFHRVDCELALEPEDSESLEEVRRLEGAIETAINGDYDVQHIVVRDLCKGALTSELIACLAERLPEANWYVASKQWQPPWFDSLPKNRVRLMLVSETAADAAIKSNDSASWIVSGGLPSGDGLEIIDTLAQEFPEAQVVVLPAGTSVIGRTPINAGDPKGHVHATTDLFSVEPFVLVATTYFSALTAQRILATKSKAPPSCESMLQQALVFTKLWTKKEGEQLRNYSWKPSDEQAFDLSREKEPIGNWQKVAWDEEKEHWEEAFRDLGIVDHDGDKEFHLWRSMSDINGYVSCVRSRRNVLRALLEQGRSFQDNSSPGHRSFMVIDSPGSGKSYLVKCLARELDLRFLEFNITQMTSRTDLLHCFDTIVTTRAQDPEKKILVFVDEINARLDGQHVYDFFLAPLEDGVYVRSGNRFRIDECLWLFAGTEHPQPRDANERSAEKSDKASDFESRLTVPPFDLKLNYGNSDEIELAKVEKIYIGISALRRYFPDVRDVSRKVLKAFRILPIDLPPRAISRFVKTFNHVEHGTVQANNFPESWFRSFDIDAELVASWRIESDDELIAIKGS